MQVALNNGTVFDTPILDFGDLNGIWYGHPVQSRFNPCWYYRQGSPVGVFGVLQTFITAVDALNDPWSRPSSLKSTCDSLRAVNWHDAEYFEPGNEGYNLIEGLNASLVWIMGSFEKGGLALTKVGSEYAFVSFSGKYTDEENGYVLYDYFTSAYELSGEWGGTYTYQELFFATLVNYTDIEADSPPIWIAFQPDGYLWAYLDEWNFNVIGGSYEASWLYNNIVAAMDNANWLSVNLGLAAFPEKPFICADNATYTSDATKGVEPIAYSFSHENYTGDGRDIYGGSEIDQSDNPFAKGGYNSNAGGGGDWDGSSDQGGWTDPSQFTIDALNSGFFTVYNPTKSEIQSFNDYLFTDITDSMATQLKKLIADPLDYVVFMAMCHFTPEVKNAKYPIKFCGLNSGVAANVVEHQMQFINCGTVFISDERETRSFLSYNPYFKVHLYLPYISEVELNVDDIMDAYVTIQYIVDMLTGSCVAQVIAKRDTKRCNSDILNPDGIVIGEYTGNVFENLPLSATDWRGLFQGVIQFAGGLAATAGGNVAGLGAMASAVLSDKVGLSRSGQIGANYGYMGFQKPYYVFERCNVAIPGDALGQDKNRSSYGGFQGWTCNILKKLGNFKGYTEVRPECLWTDNINGITSEEGEMLKELFSNGVYLNWE